MLINTLYILGVDYFRKNVVEFQGSHTTKQWGEPGTFRHMHEVKIDSCEGLRKNGEMNKAISLTLGVYNIT